MIYFSLSCYLTFIFSLIAGVILPFRQGSAPLIFSFVISPSSSPSPLSLPLPQSCHSVTPLPCPAPHTAPHTCSIPPSSSSQGCLPSDCLCRPPLRPLPPEHFSAACSPVPPRSSPAAHTPPTITAQQEEGCYGTRGDARSRRI